MVVLVLFQNRLTWLRFAEYSRWRDIRTTPEQRGAEMAERGYTASLSKSQGREGWSVIFRHPVRLDPATGKPGRRVRRGLGTRGVEEAKGLVAELNELLGD